MTIRDLLNDCIELQGQVVYCYYDEKKEKRVKIKKEEAMDYEIAYIYCENEKLYFEVRRETE